MSRTYPENGKTLLIHIGMPKAGSTSIQAMLKANRSALEMAGVCVLPLGRNHSTILSQLCQQANHDMRRSHAYDLADAGLKGADRAQIRAHVERAAAAAGPLSLCTGEGLFSFDRNQVQVLHDLFAPHFQHIRVLAYLREPVAWANSWVQQGVKSKKPLRRRDIPKNMLQRGMSDNLVPNYRRLENYLAVFGRSQIECRAFARSAFVQGDLLADFWDAVGRPDLIGRFHGEERNSAISHEAVILIDAVKALMQRFPAFKPLGNRLRHRLRFVPGEPFRMSIEEQSRVRDLARDQLHWIDKEFGVDLTRYEAPLKASKPRWRAQTLLAAGAALNELLPGALRGRRAGRPERIVSER